MGAPKPEMMPRVTDQYKVPRPERFRDVPKYVAKVTKDFFGRLLYIYKMVWEAKPLILFLMLFMALFNGVVPVISAMISKDILNGLSSAGTVDFTGKNAVYALLVLQFVFMFVENVVSGIYNAVLSVTGEKVSNHIQMKILRKAQEIDIASYDMPDFYAKMENANREAGSRPISIITSSFNILSVFIRIISFIVLLVAVSWYAPIIIVLVAIPSAVINFVFRRKNVNYMSKRSKQRRQMSYYSGVLVNKDLVKEVRMYGLDDFFCDKYQEAFNVYYKGRKQLIFNETFWKLGTVLLSTAVNCLLYIVIANGILFGGVEIGYYALYTGALTSVSGGISNIISSTAGIYEGTLFINNMIAFMNEEPHVVSTSAEPPHIERHVGHRIEFRHVSFRYPGCDNYVLKDINLTLSEGETVVLVGLNGAGKTTLIKILTRLYDPTEGEVILDGRNIKEYDPAELYRIFGVVFQDYGKYALSVSENISLSDVKHAGNRERLASAAKQSDADGFIDQLPLNYDTPLMRIFEDSGLELSGGQWQKLAIARAFYSDSDILILDEPTASLDAIAEQEIFDEFDRLHKGKTTVFVSHRLSSATIADKVAVLEYGKIIETGSHSELMKAKGRYYELFSTQAKRYNLSEETENTDEAASGNTAPVSSERTHHERNHLHNPG